MAAVRHQALRSISMAAGVRALRAPPAAKKNNKINHGMAKSLNIMALI